MELNITIIKQAMGQQQLRIKDLAYRINKTSAYVSNLLSGKRKNPSFEVITAIADALNLPLSSLLLDNGSEIKELKISYDETELLEKEIEQIKFIKKEVGQLDFSEPELIELTQHMQIIKNTRYLI